MRWLTAGAVLAGLACARSMPCDRTAGACEEVLPTLVSLDSSVVLTPGKPVAVDGTPLRLTFERVAADSRCPKDVTCVWAGNALAEIRATMDSGPGNVIEINSTEEPRVASVGGYSVRFLSLTPERVSTTPVDAAAYRLTIRVERP